MSDPSAPAGTGERPGCILGIAFGLMVLVSLAAWIWLPKGEPRSGAELFHTWFASAQLPDGYEIREARKLPGDEEVVQLVRTGAPDERPLVAPAKTPGQAPARVDWARLEQGPADQPPRSLLFVSYPKARGQSELNRLFSEHIDVGRIDEIGPDGGQMVLEFGTLPWGDRAAAYVHEREFERGGTFRESARVNLSSGGDALILRATWSRSEPFSKARLQSLLEHLRRE